MRRFFINLYIIIPIIFAGLATLSAIVAFQVTEYSLARGSSSSLPIFFWSVIISALAFICGLVVARLLLGPVKTFVRRVQQLPVLSSSEIEVSDGGQLDELKHFAQVFEQVTNVLSNVDARQLFPGIVGESNSMRRVLSQIMLIGPTDSTVLILGEAGTGKKLIASSIFRHSLRKDRPFVQVKCEGISAEDLDRELFGEETGHLTTPTVTSGKLEEANGGIIFLEEIDSLPMSIQAKILRVLQTREMERLGGEDQILRVDVRFMAATSRDLSEMVTKGMFREDLYHRINIFTLQLPPLRERREDIPLLVEHFLQNAPKTAKISAASLQLLMAYGWRNNVQELKDTIERAAMICGEGIIEVDDLPQDLKESLPHHVETVLQHAQKMESVGTIASGMAHNFRNVLSGISLNNQLLQAKYHDHPKVDEISDRINSYIQRGTQLVKDLMQFSRKQPKSRFSTLNLVEVIQETHNLIRESFDKKIDIQVAYTDPLPISGSLSGLSQVFMNLCTNARDAMPEGGQLRIEADRKGDDVEVLISDTGVGMDKEIKEKCFDPFFTTKEADKGTGLGLSTTYGIVKTHGGNIHVESEPGKGTVFKIYFPLAGWEDEDRPDDAPETISGSGQKVLIVDDEIDTLEPLEDLLESMGYQAASAGSGKAALEKQKSWKPDAVLLDRNMPEMDGVECAERMIENDPSVKIIIVSGYDETGPDSIDARSRQMIKGYLTKPVNMSELSIALAQAFH